MVDLLKNNSGFYKMYRMNRGTITQFFQTKNRSNTLQSVN